MVTQATCAAELSFSTLVDTLCFRAERQPDRTAYSFLQDGEALEVRLSYAQLDRTARAIGAWLQDAGEPGQPALLLYPPGPDFIAAFFGCLYGGMIAVPTYPPHPVRAGRTLPRLQAILDTARPQAVLTTSELLPGVNALLAGESAKSVTCCLTTDQLRTGAEGAEINDVVGLAGRWRAPAVDGNSLALIQYTSGSTGVPHGVMVSHANLQDNSAHICRLFRHTADSRGLIWLPPYHDMGLIGGILQPMYAGFEVTLMSPLHFLQQPVRWLRAVSRTRATTSGGPNFAYELCVDKVSPEELDGLDLSSWDVAFTGAEPIRAETLERFAAAFAPFGFRRDALYPCYGMAESTLMASGAPHRGPYVVHDTASDTPAAKTDGTENGPRPRRRIVGCGQPLAGQELVIVNPERLTRCAAEQVGEIWIRGASVAQGYWNRPERTQDTFAAFLTDSGEGPFLRTGDLGFLKDGELFVTGRRKDLIIIDGRNHYPHDIELTVERSHPAIRPRCCAAFSIDGDTQEQLCIVTEIERQYRPRRPPADIAGPEAGNGGPKAATASDKQGGDLQDIVRAIRRAVAEEHDLRVAGVRLLKPGTIMKTSSGKIQRFACRARYLDGTLEEI